MGIKEKKYVLLIFFLFLFYLILPQAIYAITYLNENDVWQGNLTAISFSSLIFGDIDNDGDLDLITAGDCGIGCYDSSIYVNNGTRFIENLTWQSNLTAVNYGSLAFGDIDNDGDLDLALSGCSNGGGGLVATCNDEGYQTFIYINNGTTLTESTQWENNLTNSWKGSLVFGDIDNNGRLDLAISGSSTNGYISKIYINNGTTLTESTQWENNLTAVSESALALGDIDNDGDLDFALCGDAGLSDERSKIYINNGTSLVESQQWQQDLLNVDFCSLVFGDYDNDNDLDLTLIGHTTQDNHRIYRNNGTKFVESAQNEDNDLGALWAGSLSFGDYDTDGYLDLISTGQEGYTFLHLYNVSSTNFTNRAQDPESHLLNLEFGSSGIWGDIDNDNDLDLVLAGYLEPIDPQIKVYISNRSLTKNNTKPSPPNSSFSSTYVNNVLTLSWGNGSDIETNTSGLYYNLRVGNSTNNNSIVSGVYGGSSNPTAGYFGNMMQRKRISLNVQLEANKTYYWYVQTIDTGLAKSNWSVMQSFNTSIDTTKPSITINYPSPNESLHTTNPYFVFNVTVTDANLTNVTLYADFNGTMLANETNSSGINGTYVFIRNLTNYNDNIYSWYIYACDGNNNSQTSGRSFYLDRAYPIVRLILPSNVGTWTSSNTVTFSYNVSDVDIANCSLIVNNAIVNTSTSVSENTQQNFTYSLVNENYNWQVNCTDYVEFTNSSETRSLTVSYTPPTSSAGGGGGGSTTAYKTYAINDEQLLQGYTQILFKNDKIEFLIANENHSLTLDNLSTNLSYANLTLNSIAINFLIYVNETKKFELTNDNYYELFVKLNSITENKANLTIKQIYEEIEVKEEKKEKEREEKEVGGKKEKSELAEEKLEKLWLWIIVAAVIILLIMFLRRYIKYRQWRRYALIG